ncbi:helix-turn-helix domain-containing protein [Microcystis aeruginosa]|uniref:helix-turn-helix domain-containing protein n=1 Tax=Microcystis aeruginosa TaxID=1126 RepID=UPI0009D671E7|nr:helix-turn-helix domain-containing protein [Microcystis aeruginosa]
MSEVENSNLVFYNFQSSEELEAVVDPKQEFRVMQLAEGPMRLDMWQLQLDRAIFEFRYLHAPLRVRGNKKNNNLVFEFILSPVLGPYISHGFKITQDTLYGFDNDRSIDLVLPANLLMGTLIINREIFEDCLQVMERSDLDDHFLANNYIQSMGSFSSVQDYLRELYGLVRRQDRFLEQPQISRLILEDYLPLLIESVPHKRGKYRNPERFFRQWQLAQKAEEYMLAHLDRPITLKDLCEILRSSKTPLNYAFQEVFTMSPMTYLKLLRLHAVHRALKVAEPTTKISDVARQFGFWHLGRFSQYYRQLFGQLPSETIAR